MSGKPMTREAWLGLMLEYMRPRFAELGYTLPETIDIYFGFARSGSKTAVGWCYSPHQTTDGFTPIIIVPTIWESTRVAGVFCHELIHAIGSDYMNHGKLFGKACKELGLVKPWTKTSESDEFKEWVKPFIEKHGEFPHKQRWPNKEITIGKKDTVKMVNLRCAKGCYMMKVPELMFLKKTPCCPICEKDMLAKGARGL